MIGRRVPPAGFAAAVAVTVGLLLAAPCPAANRRIYDAPAARIPLTQGKGPALQPAPATYLPAERGWIKFVYHPSTRDRVLPLLTRVDAFHEELNILLGREAFPETVEVRIAPPAELDQIAHGLDLGGASTAVFGDLRLVVLSAAPRGSLDTPELESMLRHALAHLALDQATKGATLPRWLHEGFAVHAAGDHKGLRAQTLCLAALRGQLSPLSSLDDLLPADAPEPSVAYAQSADFVRFLLDTSRREHFVGFVEHAHDGEPFAEAVGRSYEGSLAELELSWREDVARRYAFFPVLVGALSLLTLLCASAFGLRRWRERRPVSAPPPRKRVHIEREEPEPRSSRSSLPSVTPALASSARRRAEFDADEGVPKVEHGGRWHTLH
ncbi:peptidase MA family metallohydrolase [Chondromyces crocatus]|uniref:Peptidase MA-like domain-containing protein n=1 Tax=Chondromyces crocatus TaxID=52 RepID=A0A0K1EQY9_CHOCO|nr:peptidase MA family metallohydrolase [Chondromyces crocatus]AKT43345.1 uncharacterized protein CMC5_075770 [Chondromyces crocatus]